MRKRGNLKNTILSSMVTDTAVKNMDIHIIIFIFNWSTSLYLFCPKHFLSGGLAFLCSWDRVFRCKIITIEESIEPLVILKYLRRWGCRAWYYMFINLKKCDFFIIHKIDLSQFLVNRNILQCLNTIILFSYSSIQ